MIICSSQLCLAANDAAGARNTPTRARYTRRIVSTSQGSCEQLQVRLGASHKGTQPPSSCVDVELSARGAAAGCAGTGRALVAASEGELVAPGSASPSLRCPAGSLRDRRPSLDGRKSLRRASTWLTTDATSLLKHSKNSPMPAYTSPPPARGSAARRAETLPRPVEHDVVRRYGWQTVSNPRGLTGRATRAGQSDRGRHPPCPPSRP
jgi:hypothetical protein